MKTPYVDDSEMTEIIIQPDGRIYVFGLSVEVAGVLAELQREAAAQVPGKMTSGVVNETRYNQTGGVHGGEG